MKFSRAEILYPDGVALDPAYREIDRYVGLAERFHEVKCAKNITIVVCRDWADCERFATPFLGRPLAVTLPMGTVIFVTPKVGTFKPDIGELLRHELSHAVLKQGLPLLSDLRMNTQPWATEGVAGLVAKLEETALDRQPIYLPKAEFVLRAKTEELWPSFAADAVKDWRFSYTAWIYFWNRQLERSGKDTFLRFERACFAEPRACRETFGAVYGTGLRSAVDEFQLEVRSDQVVGREQTVF